MVTKVKLRAGIGQACLPDRQGLSGSLSPKWNVRLVASSESPVTAAFRAGRTFAHTMVGPDRDLLFEFSNPLQLTTPILQLMPMCLAKGQRQPTFVPLSTSNKLTYENFRIDHSFGH